MPKDIWESDINPFNPIKALGAFERMKLISSGFMPAPVTVELDLSNACNHDCTWCISQDYRQEVGRMNINTDFAMDILRQLAHYRDLLDYKIKAIHFVGGGEPLVHPDAIQIMELATDHFDVGVTSNGGMITEEFIEKIVPKLKFLRISMDAYNRESHDKTHVPRTGTYDKIVAMLATAREKAPNTMIGVGYLLHPWNFEGVDKAIETFDDIGLDYIHIRPCWPMEEKDYLTPEMLEKAHDLIDSVRNDVKHISIRAVFQKHLDMKEPVRRFNKCLSTPLVGLIGANGKMYLCCDRRGQLEFGDLNQNSFVKVWNSEHHWEVIRGVDVSTCPRCRYTKYNELMERAIIDDDMHMNFL